MKNFLKFSGVFLILVGVILLSVYIINNLTNNTFLAVGGLLIILGVVAYILLNRYLE